jgi:hypothetical protein
MYPVSRREALQWVLTATATLAAGTPELALAQDAPGPARPYGTDPLLNKTYQPGDFWPLTFTPEQRRTAAALADLILPADDTSPAASTVGVPAFLDEWISAPYPAQQADRPVLLDGLAWLDAESRRRGGPAFADATLAQQAAIADDLCHAPAAPPQFAAAAKFFALFRNLACGGYYTSPAGMKDIGFRGNVPLTKFDGPPREVLARLGLA